jgi:hypothetical protein
MEFIVKIQAGDLAEAIRALAEALGNKAAGPASETRKGEPEPVAQAPAQAPQPMPTAPMPVAAPTVVPTAAPSYTREQLAIAARELVDSGRKDRLIELLGAFGAQALAMLPEPQYGAFAAKMRELGAKI